MLANNIKGQINHPAVMDNDSIRPVSSTCLKPEAHFSGNYETRISYTKNEQILGWFTPKGLGNFRERISLLFLRSRISAIPRMTTG